MARWRFSSRLKALLPVGGVLIAGLVAFVWATLSMGGPERHRVLLVAAAGAVTICAVVLVVWAVLIEHPLLELHEKLARVREGDLNVSVTFAGRSDEIGDLGRNFNETVRQLRETLAEIQRLHSTQMSRAEHLATLGELAAGLAHEIRNPLAGIAGVIDVIGRDLPPANPNREVLQEVKQEILHIQKILADLLVYARPRPVEYHAADLNETAEHAVNLARQQVLSQPIQVEFHKAEGLPPVEHDPTLMQQVFLNLLLNGIQAIEASGEVRLDVESRNGCAVVEVADTGRGIPPESLPNIFRPFFTTKGGGTGLGLSLARRIVEDHGGAIEVSSAPGRGSQFTVRLPFRKNPSPAQTS